MNDGRDKVKTRARITFAAVLVFVIGAVGALIEESGTFFGVGVSLAFLIFASNLLLIDKDTRW